MTRDKSRRLAGFGLVLAAASIPVQIAGGVDYPVVPPGLLILVVAAAAVLSRWRWALVLATVATLFLSVGAIVAPNFRQQLGDPGATVAFVGSLTQAVGLLLGLAGCVVALARLRTPKGVSGPATVGGRARR